MTPPTPPTSTGDATPQRLRPGALEPRRLDEVLVDGFDEAARHEAWQRLVAARQAQAPRARARSRWVLGLSLGAACAATALALLAWRGDQTEPRGAASVAAAPLASRDPALALREGASLIAPPTAALTVDFTDGSVVTLGSGASLDVMSNRADELVTLLGAGRAHFEAPAASARRWQIETALATIEAVGTEFELERDDARLVVSVQRGVVMVRGERVPGRIVRLTAGERIEIRAAIETAVLVGGDADGRTAAASDDGAQASGAARSGATAAAEASAGSMARPGKPADGRVPLREPTTSAPTTPPTTSPRAGGSGSAAVAATGAASTVEPARTSASPGSIADALAAADALRGRGDYAGAAATLGAALDANKDGAGAGLAAFTLGRLAMERLGQPTRAARAFERMIELGSPAGLLEDAYVRRARAWHAAGNAAEARRATDDYQRAYPKGGRLDDLAVE